MGRGRAVAPGRGEALIRQTAVGLNFIDIYERTGLYGGRCRPGSAARPRAWSKRVGPGVRDAQDRRSGGLCVDAAPARTPTSACMAADRLVTMPEGVSDRLAAAAMLKGMTAQVLLRRTYKVQQGHGRRRATRQPAASAASSCSGRCTSART